MIKTIATIIIILSLAVIIWYRFKKTTNNTRHEQDLVKRCFGDTALSQRLINLELKRNPKLSRENAAKDAIESLIRDNR